MEKIGYDAFHCTGVTIPDIVNDHYKESVPVFYVGSYVDENGEGHGLNWAVQTNFKSNELDENHNIVIADYVNNRPVVGVVDGWGKDGREKTPDIESSFVFPSTLKYLGTPQKNSTEKKPSYYYEKLKSVTFDDLEHCQLTKIKNDIFMGCTSLEKVEIPNSVTSIGEFAFSGCTLKEIVIENCHTNVQSSNSVILVGFSLLN